MKNNRTTEIKVGITVLLGLIVFIWILGWTKNFTLTSSDTKIKIMFDNVSGLEIGNDVTINGVKKGYVKDFEVNKTFVTVTLFVNKEIELMKDATFSLVQTDIMGGRKIEIDPGTSVESLDLETVHRGIYKTDITSLVAVLGDLQTKVDVIINEATEVLHGINVFVNDDSFKEDIKQGIANLNSVSVRLEQMLSENQENIKEITNNTKEITADTKTFLKENKNSMELAVKNLNSSLIKSDSLLSTLNIIAQETKAGNNNLGKLLYEDSVYINLIESIQTLKELSKTILEQIKNDGLKVDADIF